MFGTSDILSPLFKIISKGRMNFSFFPLSKCLNVLGLLVYVRLFQVFQGQVVVLLVIREKNSFEVFYTD